jgi:hypothetical protein
VEGIDPIGACLDFEAGVRGWDTAIPAALVSGSCTAGRSPAGAGTPERSTGTGPRVPVDSARDIHDNQAMKRRHPTTALDRQRSSTARPKIQETAGVG